MSEISLRAIQPEDMEFLCRVYASTRAEELAPVPWTDDQKAQFVRMQFDAQHHHYAEHYPQAQFQVIEWEDAPAGRLYVDRRAGEIRIVDIALLPEYRRMGIGTRLLSDLLTEGRQRNVPVTIHVERFNPALRLYERLGFRMAEDRGVYILMQWTPPPDEVSPLQLESLQSADFNPHVHQFFRVAVHGAEPINLELVSVHNAGQTALPGKRQPFSLLFLGPESTVYLPQHTYRLLHDRMGILDLFIVPLGLDGKRMRYEAIFS